MREWFKLEEEEDEKSPGADVLWEHFLFRVPYRYVRLLHGMELTSVGRLVPRSAQHVPLCHHHGFDSLFSSGASIVSHCDYVPVCVCYFVKALLLWPLLG